MHGHLKGAWYAPYGLFPLRNVSQRGERTGNNVHFSSDFNSASAVQWAESETEFLIVFLPGFSLG